MIDGGAGSCHKQKTYDNNYHTDSNQYQIVLAKRTSTFNYHT